MSGLLARLRARIPLEEGSLVLITMIWGATFIIIRSALEATGPFFFVGVRFAFAACSPCRCSRTSPGGKSGLA